MTSRNPTGARRLICLAAALGSIAALTASPLHAQNAADPSANQATARTEVGIRAGGALSNTADLEFGAIVPGPGGGTFTVNPDGTTSVTGQLVPVGETHPASFRLERRILLDFPRGYEPDLPDTITLVHTTDASQTLTVDNLTSNFGRTILRVTTPILPPIRIPAWVGRLNYDFTVGGRLTVPEGQRPGTYEGTFEVVVDFR